MKGNRHLVLRALFLGATALTGGAVLTGTASAQAAGTGSSGDAQAAATSSQEAPNVEEVIVTGFRKSLETAAFAKRANPNFTDSIFADDLGKFPDVNLAESLQRLPGVQIERDNNNEGSRINVRGLGSQFTLLSLSGSQITSVSETYGGGGGESRGVSLDLFPTELFRSLTISKSPTASQLEGAIAGNVDLRPVRPFDRPGFNLNTQIRGVYQDIHKKISPRLGLFVSDTWDTNIGRIGLLSGFSYVYNNYRSDQFHTVGHTTYNLQTRCPTTRAGCNSQTYTGNASNPTVGYGGGATLPTTVPANTGFGLVAGAALNPCGPGGTSGLSCEDLSYAIIPRLARSEFQTGNRKRGTGLFAAQWEPMPDLTFNVDVIYSKASQYYSQNDLMLQVRSTTNVIPIGFEVNQDHLLTKGTFANVQMLSENRRVYTDSDFANYYGGFDYKVSDRVRLRGSFAYNTSSLDQHAWTFLLRTAPGIGLAVDYNHPAGAATPTLTPNKNVNDPNLGWVWDTLRVQPQFRDATQRDAQLHAEFGEEDFKVSTGVQIPKYKRNVVNWDVSNCATNAVNGTCGAGSTVTSARNGAIASVPNSALNSYMQPFPYSDLYRNSSFDVGMNKFALPDYDKLESAIDIKYFERDLDPVTRVQSINPRSISESTKAAYVQVDGKVDLVLPIRYNAGVRYFETTQNVSGIVTDPAAGRGVQFFDNKYDGFLPSANVSVDLTEKLILRVAAARTITRPNPADLAPGFSLSVSGDTLTLGNPELKPFYAKQFDAGVEWYVSRNSTIAVNLWQKNVKGFTEIVRRQERFGDLGVVFANLAQATKDGLTNAGNGNPNNAIVQVNQRQNTSEIIRLRGAEVTWMQPLDFVIKGLGFTANYTRIDISTNAPPTIIGTRKRKPPVTSLSPNTVNASVYYENEWLSARVSYNYRDPYIVSFGPSNNVEGDNILEKTSFVDAAISIALPFMPDMRLLLEAQNLTNQAQIVNVDGNRQMPLSANAPGRTFTIGLTARL